MNKLLFTACACVVGFSSIVSFAQRRDEAHFIEYKNPYWEKIEKSIDDFEKPKQEAKQSFMMDFSKMDIPKSIDEFKKVWYNPPISQGSTGTCWCFSGTSFLESEIYRLHHKKLKISEMFTVYWEYIEKARRYVRERGNSHFAEGSQGDAVIRVWKQYGCVPEEAYTGLKPGQEFHHQDVMCAEMLKYLESVKAANAWNEDAVLATIKSILNHYIGEPPTKVTVDGKEMTPMEYMQNVTELNLDDYVDVMSQLQKPFWEKSEYIAEDNWWHGDQYYNVPLDDFMKAIKKAVEKGYSMFIGGDVSEPGYYSFANVAMIPSWDIPSEYIDDNARQFRISNNTTTDDHGIHMVGYKIHNGDYWFLIKDSGSGSRNGANKGYYFYHQDYVKLKMMNFMIHRSAVEDLLKKCK